MSRWNFHKSSGADLLICPHKAVPSSITRINLAPNLPSTVVDRVDVGVGQPRDHVKELLSRECRRAGEAAGRRGWDTTKRNQHVGSVRRVGRSVDVAGSSVRGKIGERKIVGQYVADESHYARTGA